MAQHADQPLPRLALLLAQRAAHVGQHDELVRRGRPAGTCRAAPPSARAPPGNVELEHAGRVALRHPPSPSSLGRSPEQPLAGLRRAAARRARLTSRSAPLVVEREDRDVDLGHHAAQQRGGLERTEPPLAQLVGRAR